MILGITRWLAASLNVAVCATVGYGFVMALQYNVNMQGWNTFAWICGVFLSVAALSAAVGLSVHRLLWSGLRLHNTVMVAGFASSVALLAHAVLTCSHCAAHIPWEFLYFGVCFTVVWASFGLGIRALAVRAK